MNTLTDETFESSVKNSAIPVLVDIFTEWCPPCKMLGPIVEKLSEEYKGKVEFFKMDLDKNPKTGDLFGVEMIPTVVLFIKGELKDKFVGLKQEDEIRTWINSRI
ncbi:MAG: thioredoxin [Candidatus Paceibacterota bacterium]|jgi:thioredoxin 1